MDGTTEVGTEKAKQRSFQKKDKRTKERISSKLEFMVAKVSGRWLDLFSTLKWTISPTQ